MELYRILAVIKKDIIWCFSNRYIFVSLLATPFVLLILTSSQSVTVSLSEAGQVMYKDLHSRIVFMSFAAIVAVGFLTGVVFTTTLFLEEKKQEMFYALLSTPLKPLEFIIAKLFLTFSVCFLFVLIFISVRVFVDSNNLFMLSSIFVFNCALLLATFCVWGAIFGLYTKNMMHFQVIMLPITVIFILCMLVSNQQMHTITPFVKQLSFYMPTYHIYGMFKNPDWTTSLFHTSFQVWFLFCWLWFADTYAKFYFLSSREEKTFSKSLWMKLGTVIVLTYGFSGFFSSASF